MGCPTAKRQPMNIWIGVLILLGGLLLASLTGCSGGTKYQVDYCGGKDCYSNAKDSYRAGSTVTLYFELIATDTDYHFFLDGEPLPFGYDEKKGFVIRFTMPEHDVKLEVSSENSMLPQNGGGGGFAQVVNPLSEQTLEELEMETGYSLQLPEEQFWSCP